MFTTHGSWFDPAPQNHTHLLISQCSPVLNVTRFRKELVSSAYSINPPGVTEDIVVLYVNNQQLRGTFFTMTHGSWFHQPPNIHLSKKTRNWAHNLIMQCVIYYLTALWQYSCGISFTFMLQCCNSCQHS